MTSGQVEQARIEQVEQLLQAGDRDAISRLRELLFDVRRGAREVSGAQAVSLARSAFKLDLWDDVADWARRALDLELDPNERVLAQTLLINALYRQSRFAEALSALVSADEQPGDASPGSRLQLELVAAQVEAKMGLLEQALERCDRAERWAEEAGGELRAAFESTRGTTLNELGRNEEAVVAYERALDASPEPATAILLNLGNALRDLGRYEEADRRYREALEAEPSDRTLRGAVLSNHARVLAARDDVARAKAMLRDAFELRGAVDPAGAAISAEELAKLYARDADYGRAAQWTETAIALRASTGQPEDAWLREFSSKMRSVGATLATRPEVAAHVLLQRMRAAGFAEWPVEFHDPPEEVIRNAVAELAREIETSEGAASAEDRWLLALLNRVCEVGRQLALAEHSERMADLQAVAHAALDVIRHEQWLDRKRRYEARRHVLERPFALEVLQVLKPRAGELSVGPEAIEGLAALIQRCMVAGVDLAFAELPEAHPNELINRLVQVGTWRETLGLVKAHPELLSDATVDLLEKAARAVAPPERERIAQHIRVLKRCREVGPGRAFGEAPSYDGLPLGVKVVIEPIGADNGQGHLAEAEALATVVAQTGDPELIRLAEVARLEAAVPHALEVVHGESAADPDALEWAADVLARAARNDHARAAFRRLGQVRLAQAGTDRASALVAAAGAFQRAVEIGATVDEALTGDLMLELGKTLLELWRIDPSSPSTLLRAKEAFDGALRLSPVERAAERARDAARGLTEAATAFLATSPDRSQQVLVRQVKIHACRAAIAATDQLLLEGLADDPVGELAGTLWAYQGALEELGALGFWGGALATAEHGRARGFLAQINRLTTTSKADQIFAAMPSTADHLIGFLADRPPTDVVLAWYVTGSDCYAFALLGGSREVRGVATNLDPQRLGAFVRLVADGVWQRPSRLDEPLSPALNTIMDELIPPDWRELVGRAEHVILVPHGAVAKLPLHALPAGWLEGRCLVDVARVRYLPGVAVANRLRGRPQGGDLSLVLSCDGDPGRAPSEFELEARAVAATVGGDHLYVGDAARPKCLFDHGSRAALIHIAAHGSFDDADPLSSGMFLADGHSGHVRLSARDVARLPELPGSVVVLSGCETSRQSVDLTGEGLGLVRAFLAAGARAVVASQWLVDSPATRALMERFHSELQRSGDVTGSLRTAMLSSRQSKGAAHPYYWAPFVAVEALP